MCGGHLSDVSWPAGAQPVLLRPPSTAGLYTHLQTDTPAQTGALPDQNRGNDKSGAWLTITPNPNPICVN